MICKNCNEKFHYCSSCGIDGHSEYGYCSDECMSEGERSDIYRILFRGFCKSLNNAQLSTFQRLMDNVDDYLLCKWLNEIRRENLQ